VARLKAFFTHARPGTRLRQALWLSLALLGLRLHASYGLGYGDAEALYASYAMHPQPAYLDHPGLIGYLLRLLGGGTAPSPQSAHALSAVVATLVPWLGALAARASGLTWERAALTVLALALVPELSVGLFGVSPDLPLAVCWLTALALALHLNRALPEHASTLPVLLSWLGLGLLLGLGVLAKVSAALLCAALFVASFGPGLRRYWRGPGPWCALGCGAILIAPLAIWELRHDFPMLEHRLVTTQTESGLGLKNLLKFVGGQLVYVTPPFLMAGYLVARDLYAKRHNDSASQVLWLSLVIPLSVLTVLSLWSARAEPHWVAPALLPLGIHAARMERLPRRLGIACLATGAVLTAGVWLAVKTDAYIKLATSSLGEALGGYQPRYDLTNDLYAWGPGQRVLRQAVDHVSSTTGHTPVVVGAPHWMVCAQAQVAVRDRVPVGCHSILPTDFDRWTPRADWLKAGTLLLVEDSRYPVLETQEFPLRQVRGTWRAQVRRAGRVVRTIHITSLEKTSDVASAGLTGTGLTGTGLTGTGLTGIGRLTPQAERHAPSSAAAR